MNDLGTPLQVFIRNTISLMLREMRTKFGEQKLSYVWALIEPLGWILMLSMLFKGLGRDSPPIGDSFVVFFVTGLVPFSTWRDTGNVVRNAIQSNKPLLYFPVINPIDIMVSRAVLETLTQVSVFGIIIVTYSFIYREVPQVDWLNVMVPFLLMAIMGFNTGVINCVIIAHFKFWKQIWGVISRPLFILSAIFYTADSLPKAGQDILYWNPMAHCIEWVRSGFFPGFQSQFLDRFFIVSFVISGLFLALGLERLYRKKLLE